MQKESRASVSLAPPPPPWVLRTMNHLMRPLLASRLASRMPGVMLLEFQGRRTGRTIKVPVNAHFVDGVVMAFTQAPWRYNFVGRCLGDGDSSRPGALDPRHPRCDDR